MGVKPAVSPSPSVCEPKKAKNKNERVASTYLALDQAWTEQMTQESPKIQRNAEDQLEVWSIRNNKTKIHLGTTGISQLETDHLPPHAHFRPGWDSVHCQTLLCGHTLHCFSRKQEGFSGHGRRAKQGFFAQTLKTGVTKAALAQSTPFHSAGQDSQQGPSLPWILSAHPARLCLPRHALPWGPHQAPASWVGP